VALLFDDRPVDAIEFADALVGEDIIATVASNGAFSDVKRLGDLLGGQPELIL